MIRVKPNTLHIKRTIRPLYGNTQATPASAFLDPDHDRTYPKWPGFAMVKGNGELVRFPSDADDLPYGLAAQYVGGDGIDEPLEVGINAMAVWKLSPDAEFEILAPAFDHTQTWADGDLVYAATDAANAGRLVPEGYTTRTTAPIARVLKIASPTKIVIGGLQPRTA